MKPSREIWKPIPGFPDFVITPYGRIVSYVQKRFGAEVAPWLNKQIGYLQVNLGRMHRFTIHELVCIAYIGPRPASFTVNHKDGNKLNNHIDNLEYVTYSENNHHALRIGLRRSRNGNAKLTEDQVLEIRDAYSKGALLIHLGKLYRVSPGTIQRIIKRITWSHI